MVQIFDKFPPSASPENRRSCYFDHDRGFLGKGAPFNGRRDRSRRELRVDSGVRGTQHASRCGTPWGVKPVDNVLPSASHTADEWATCSDSQTSPRLRTNIAPAQLTFRENIATVLLTLRVSRHFGDYGTPGWPRRVSLYHDTVAEVIPRGGTVDSAGRFWPAQTSTASASSSD